MEDTTDDSDPISKPHIGPIVIPSSQPDIDVCEAERGMLKQTPVAAVCGRRKGEPSPSPSTLALAKSKVVGKSGKVILAKKAEQRERKQTKSKNQKQRRQQQELTSEDEDVATAEHLVVQHHRPARSSKLVAVERMRKVASSVSEWDRENSEEEEDEEESGNVSEYKPLERKSKQTAKQAAGSNPGKVEHNIVEPELDSALTSTSHNQSKSDDEDNKGSKGLNLQMQSPDVLLVGGIEGVCMEGQSSQEVDAIANCGDSDVVNDGSDSEEKSDVTVGGYKTKDSERRDTTIQTKADRQSQGQRDKRQPASSKSQSLLEFTRSIIRQRYEQRQRSQSSPLVKTNSNSEDCEQHAEVPSRKVKKKDNQNVKNQGKICTTEKAAPQTGSKQLSIGRKRSSPVVKSVTEKESHQTSHNRRNKRGRRLSDSIPPSGSDTNGSTHTPALRVGRRMGVLDVMTTPSSVKSTGRGPDTDGKEESKGKSKELDVEDDDEEIGDIGHVLHQNVNTAVVPDVGMEQEVEETNFSPLASFHYTTEELQSCGNEVYYLVTPNPTTGSSKDISKSVTSGYSSMLSPLKSGPPSRKRPRLESSTEQFIAPNDSFDGVSNGLSMNESESEEGGLEAQPTLARRLFQTPNELGLMSVGSPSEKKGRNVSLHNVSADLSGVFKTFGHQIQESVSGKKKLMEKFVHKVDDCMMQHIDKFVDRRSKKRHQAFSHFVEKSTEKLSECEKSVQRMKKTGKRLESVFADTMEALNCCLDEQKENVASIKQLQEHIDCHMKRLTDEDKQEQQLLKGELQQELTYLREKISREFQQQGLTSLRRSLHSMAMDM